MPVIYKNIFLPSLFLIIQFNLFLIYSPIAQAKKIREALTIINEHKDEVLVEESQSVRRQRDLKVPEENGNEENECTIRVTKVIEYPGKCVRINGGTTACQNDRFLDPLNKGC
ncbi:hypothetical protein ACQ4LE_009199 [Meloidogyne hapla]|uniref:Uncharacterized protein n=1 Tax=Meloidogyne hapla TaxID=6305 RepID=A0A1I8BFM0_MELHA